MTNLLLVLLNAIMFMLQWRGISVTIPIMFFFTLVSLFFIIYSAPVTNITFQLWSLFIVTFIVISFPVTLYYGETHETLDIFYSLRSYVYNFIVTFCCYKYTLFAMERGKTISFLNWLMFFLIIGTSITVFAIPIGFYKLNFVIPPRFLSLTRMAGVYLDPNQAGFAANLTAIFGLASLFRPNSSKLLGILSVVLGFAGIVASFSKTGILSLLLLLLTTFVIYAVMYRRIEPKIRRGANIFFTFILYGIFQLLIFIAINLDTLPKDQRERIQQIENIIMGKADKSDTSNRANLVELGLSKIAERPLLGTGYLSFTYLLDAGSQTGDNVGVHNIFLRVWGEAGIIPFLLFLGFWTYTLWQSLQLIYIWQKILIFSLAITTIVYGLTVHTFFEDNFIGAIIGIMLAFLAQKKDATVSDSIAESK